MRVSRRRAQGYDLTSKTRAGSIAYERIFCSTEQGIFLLEGIFSREQGILRVAAWMDPTLRARDDVCLPFDSYRIRLASRFRPTARLGNHEHEMVDDERHDALRKTGIAPACSNIPLWPAYYRQRGPVLGGLDHQYFQI